MSTFTILFVLRVVCYIVLMVVECVGYVFRCLAVVVECYNVVHVWIGLLLSSHCIVSVVIVYVVL